MGIGPTKWTDAVMPVPNIRPVPIFELGSWALLIWHMPVQIIDFILFMRIDHLYFPLPLGFSAKQLDKQQTPGLPCAFIAEGVMRMITFPMICIALLFNRALHLRVGSVVFCLELAFIDKIKWIIVTSLPNFITKTLSASKECCVTYCYR